MKTPCRIVIDCVNSLIDDVLFKLKKVFYFVSHVGCYISEEHFYNLQIFSIEKFDAILYIHNMV